MATGNMELTRQSTLFSSRIEGSDEQREDIDFKMVTFSLGGKEYGVDIMKVKEIAKFEGFTYVPNTQPFVSGVYNLRGDIISVIDLRIMFNLPAAQQSEGTTQDGLILRLDTGLVGVVVDNIDKVVGIASESIQPPHPIFADINIKYISGVVEHDDRLYIILDVERILGESEQEEARDTVEPSRAAPAPAERSEVLRKAVGDPSELIAPTLATLSGFTMTDLNRAWVKTRLEEWSRQHDGTTNITTQDEVDEFLAAFFSPFSGRFIEGEYADSLQSLFPQTNGNVVTAWNPGCGKGYESYSLACLLRMQYPEARIKVWAGDNDLINVSTAPNVVFDRRAVPDLYTDFLVEGNEGHSFNAEIKQMILFEFSDVTYANAIPPCDVIVIRDLLSFLSERDQRRVAAMIEEKAKESTVVITGTNENLTSFGSFVEVSTGSVRAFRIR